MMDYFLETTMGTANTVIEQAALDRLTIFAAMGRPAKLILSGYSPLWTSGVKRSARPDILSVFDYFQKVDDFDRGPLHRADLDGLLGLYDFHKSMQNDRLLDYVDGDRWIARVRVNDSDEVQTVTYLDSQMHRMELDRYDSRGFLSRRQYWQNKQVTAEDYLSPDGTVTLQILYDQRNQPVMVRIPESQVLLPDVNGLIHEFCMHELASATAVISDRRELDWLLSDWPATHKVIRAYKEVPKDIPAQTQLITRQPGASGVVIDEYADKDSVALQQAWQQVLA